MSLVLVFGIIILNMIFTVTVAARVLEISHTRFVSLKDFKKDQKSNFCRKTRLIWAEGTLRDVQDQLEDLDITMTNYIKQQAETQGIAQAIVCADHAAASAMFRKLGVLESRLEEVTALPAKKKCAKCKRSKTSVKKALKTKK